MKASRRAVRLVTKTLVATFLTSAAVLAVVFVAMTVMIDRSVRSSVTRTLSVVQQVLSDSEARHSEELRASLRGLAERPTLKAALDTYRTETRWAGPSDGLLETLQSEARLLAAAVDADLVGIAEPDGTILVTSGRGDRQWSVESLSLDLSNDLADGERVIRTEQAVIRAMVVPLTLDVGHIGWMVVGERLDREFAERLSGLADTAVAIISSGTLMASSLPGDADDALARVSDRVRREQGTIELAGETYAFRRILDLGDAEAFALSSIDALAGPAARQALQTMAALALLAIMLSGLASMWLARSVASPIDELSGRVKSMAETRDLHSRLVPTGTSRELDRLSTAFNQLMEALAVADEEAQSAYVAGIRGLAATLDTRDPYTAGHSERVSLLSVEVGRQLGLSETEQETLHIGALLHDIGKIGVPDAVLQKVSPLTEEEFEVIKTHTTLGGRILRTVPFLAPHVPVAELHHERPDGKGYPHGLAGDEIPLFARIVHVVDAYDAMTTARAYRAARPRSVAIDELWRGAGAEFDVTCVQALVSVLPGMQLPRTPTPAARLHVASFTYRGGVYASARERAG